MRGEMKMYRCNVRWLIAGLAFSMVGWAHAGDHRYEPAHTDPDYSRQYTDHQLAPSLEPGRLFYVSVHGDDRNSGTRGAPLRSLVAARDAIRSLRREAGLPVGGIHVVVMDGHYHLDGPLQLTREDAGTVKTPIVYRGTGADKVVLTAGVELDTHLFKLVKDEDALERLHPRARGPVMCIHLADSQVADYFPGEGKYGLISMDGHLLQLARWPNRGYNHIDTILDKGPTTRWLKPGEEPAPYSKEQPTGGRFTCRETLSLAVQAEFARSGDMRARGYFHNDWYFQDEPIGRIRGREIQLLRYTRYGIEEKIKSMPRRVRLANVLCELDEPGEWYFDRRAQRLYVWPIAGFVPARSRVTVLGGGPLIQMKDTSYVTFRNMTIENTGDLGVRISGGQYNLLAGCVVRNGIQRGASVEGGRYNGISGCDFYGLHTGLQHLRRKHEDTGALL